MAITTASIEPNGWVLRVTHTAGVGSFASYSLDPNGAPTLRVAAATQGFIQSAAAVSAAVTTRTIVATKPLRRPVQATNAGVRDAKTIDEVVNGNGTVTVRIALSQHIYATDAGLVLTATAGWRAGEPAQSLAVANGSTLAAPQPIVRWSDVPYQLREGSFDLEVVVASQHPIGKAPVAGVRFTVTDGTTIKTYWATALSTSSSYSAGGTGQGVRAYRVTVDPATAPALTRGLLRCDYKVFPWIGPARVSDTADTALTAVASSNAASSMTALGTAGLANGAQVPFVVAYSPAATWITPRYAYVVADGSGASTPSASLVSANPATASATPCNSINIAAESLRLHAVANTGVGTLAAANGQAAVTQSLDGCRIRLKAGTGVHLGLGSTSVTSGMQTAASWLIIEGDPADPNPRANIVLRVPSSANGSGRQTRTLYRRVSVEAGSLNVALSVNAWLDDVEVRGTAGAETVSTPPINATGGSWYTNVRWWKYGIGPAKSGTTQFPILVRNCEVERGIGAPVVLNCRRLPSALAATIGIIGEGGSLTPSVLVGLGMDRIAIGNDLRYLNGATAFGWSGVANSLVPAQYTSGTTYPVFARQAFINNVCEIYGTSSPLILPVGENNPGVITETILEGNTFAGDRTNLDYNDLNLATIALNDSENSIAILNRRANNVFHRSPTKHDNFQDGFVQQQRMGTGQFSLASSRNKTRAVGDELTANGNIYRCTVAGTTAATGGPSGTGSAIIDGTVTWTWYAVADARQHGFRPQAVGSWSSLYGVGNEGNVDLQPATDGQFDPDYVFEFYGINSVQTGASGINLTASPFVFDNSGTSQRFAWQAPSGTGGGNYVPVAPGTTAAGISASYVIGRAQNANVDRDRAGSPRGATVWAAGALEPTSVSLTPASASHTTSSRSVGIQWQATLAVDAARSVSRAAPTAARWSVMLVPQPARSPGRSTNPQIGWRALLTPAPSAFALQSTSSGITTTGPAMLAPASARHVVADVTRPVLLPATPTPVERTLTVTGDFRVAIVG